MNLVKLVTAAALTLAATTMPAMADCRRKINLQAATAGDFSGKADVREQAGSQRFKVSMDARVPDGVTYIVTANGMAVGTLTIRLGDGELELTNANGKALPQGANPVCSIGPVSVMDSDGRMILTGSF